MRAEGLQIDFPSSSFGGLWQDTPSQAGRARFQHVWKEGVQWVRPRHLTEMGASANLRYSFQEVLSISEAQSDTHNAFFKGLGARRRERLPHCSSLECLNPSDPDLESSWRMFFRKGRKSLSRWHFVKRGLKYAFKEL